MQKKETFNHKLGEIVFNLETIFIGNSNIGNSIIITLFIDNNSILHVTVTVEEFKDYKIVKTKELDIDLNKFTLNKNEIGKNLMEGMIYEYEDAKLKNEILSKIILECRCFIIRTYLIEDQYLSENEVKEIKAKLIEILKNINNYYASKKGFKDQEIEELLLSILDYIKKNLGLYSLDLKFFDFCIGIDNTSSDAIDYNIQFIDENFDFNIIGREYREKCDKHSEFKEKFEMIRETALKNYKEIDEYLTVYEEELDIYDFKLGEKLFEKCIINVYEIFSILGVNISDVYKKWKKFKPKMTKMSHKIVCINEELEKLKFELELIKKERQDILKQKVQMISEAKNKGLDKKEEEGNVIQFENKNFLERLDNLKKKEENIENQREVLEKEKSFFKSKNPTSYYLDIIRKCMFISMKE